MKAKILGYFLSNYLPSLGRHHTTQVRLPWDLEHVYRVKKNEHILSAYSSPSFVIGTSCVLLHLILIIMQRK